MVLKLMMIRRGTENVTETMLGILLSIIRTLGGAIEDLLLVICFAIAGSVAQLWPDALVNKAINEMIDTWPARPPLNAERISRSCA